MTPGLSLNKSTSGLSLDPYKRAASPAYGFQPSGLRTPTTHGYMPPTPGAGQPTTGVTVGDTVGTTGGIGFGLHEPARMRKAMSKSTDGAPLPAETNPADNSPAGDVAVSSSSNGTSAGNSSKSEGSSTSTSNPQAHGLPRGTLNVKLISARGLAVSHSSNVQPQPYVVMQFEQNEFVSSPPHPVASPSSVPFTTATAQPMLPGNLSRSTSGLGVGTITRAFADAVGRGKGKRDGEGVGAQTPRAEEPAGGGSWLGKPGPGDPVWKEEVSL